ncbi:hypothetical protein HBI56_180500 [Parastagonospora nodorum]|uniref:Uncharacterized protein n=1 Tax=Phaeosphaeria nodorum (strain SN15 / ATCC MYA-4574 / FGSC 10173) TaxID=321614 RepID=A0A7U2F970_PHANO|nr:hypothetical protein HBH56_185930 [Parastagonospora nodorum]QRD01065.1 hypothetical protein JI435_153330 [Parastagonospora nodorum SN15]KAH3925346.1 hypothetical protein HBH54_182630 [Parastagonospora nodorum]KAH3962217.1 hypothetical protein HBH52_226390 [Parastagonospora nodorum]KAH4015950.1 hypothetical protein HBI09_204020 [Parastagonospora nodorum]
MTVSHPCGDATSLRRSIDEHRKHTVCPHIGMRQGSPEFAPAQLAELAPSPTSEFRVCEGAFGSCPFCLTDYRIDISWQGEKKGYAIKLFVYSQLGDCRSPFEWSWRSRLAVRIDEKHRTDYSADYGPGYVRDQWNKAEGFTCSSRGGWVNVPGMSAGALVSVDVLSGQ